PAAYAWDALGDYAINEGFTGFDAYDQIHRLRGNLGKVRSASSMVLIADGRRRPGSAAFWDPAFPGWILWTPIDFFGTSPVTLADAWLDRMRSTKRTLSQDNFDPVRHNGKMNVAFLDGHVETLPMTERGLAGAVLIR